MVNPQKKRLPIVSVGFRWFALWAVSIWTGCASPNQQAESPAGAPARVQIQNRKFQLFELSAEKVWQIDVPGGGRFDASGLIMKGGDLYTVNDRGPELFQIVLQGESARAQATSILNEAAMRLAEAGAARFDTEGIALDEKGNFYICEESRRAVFIWDAEGNKARALELNFESVAHLYSSDQNASFEGIAIGEGKLYLAHERNRAVVIVMELPSGETIDHFHVQPRGFALGGSHYSDLAWFDGKLFILDRNFRCILEVDPTRRTLLAQYNFGKMEQAAEVVYHTQFPTGTMEGLAVTAEYFFLVTDNNGLARRSAKGDIRPTLFRVRRPSVAGN